MRKKIATPTSRRWTYGLRALWGFVETPAATAVWVSSTHRAAIARSESTSGKRFARAFTTAHCRP
jgi:hypothetical protein